jgi:endonuclease YncB( thermonuclease family)
MQLKLKISRRTQKWLLALVLALLLGGSGYTAANFEEVKTAAITNQPGLYRVISVEDGDTITVDSGGKPERVRMIGVDTPETHHPQKAVQCFGAAAHAYTQQLIGQSQVRLEADPEDDNRDVYGRLLRYIYLPDDRLVNAEIVKNGYGFAYTRFPFTKLEEFRQFETQAREQQLGLWQGCQVEDDGVQKSTNDAP